MNIMICILNLVNKTEGREKKRINEHLSSMVNLRDQGAGKQATAVQAKHSIVRGRTQGLR